MEIYTRYTVPDDRPMLDAKDVLAFIQEARLSDKPYTELRCLAAKLTRNIKANKKEERKA